MKLLTVIGARPQFIKAAAVGYAIDAARRDGLDIQSVLVHTGQHYDEQMSKVFFDELKLQPPDHHLAVGSMSHGAQTGRMLEGIEHVIELERPDAVLVYGDTNSTLAGALAAAKLHVPIAHIEAGLRSFNRRMPEELNRVVTDHLSEWLFCPTETAVINLQREGIQTGVSVVGDVMYELVARFGTAEDPTTAVNRDAGPYVLVTVHRAENTDDAARLSGIINALNTLAESQTVIFPVHPRTRKLLMESGVRAAERIQIVEPFGYLAMLRAQAGASVMITDSGGVQKEAYWLGTPCVTVRNETEWVETLVDARNILCATDPELLIEAVRRQLVRGRRQPPIVRDAAAGTAIISSLTSRFLS